jgi:uncharacterized protein
MESLLNHRLKSEQGLDILLDCHIPRGKGPFPLLVFCHGFKGFKNWGFFNALPAAFNASGIALLTFNFSCSGVDPDNPADINTPDTFALQTIGAGLNDLKTVLQWVFEGPLKDAFDTGNISLGGHSMGGGIALLAAASDKRIARLTLWNSVSDWDIFMQQFNPEAWQATGYAEVKNARTGDTYPLRYQFYEDYIHHRGAYHLGQAAESLEIPLLLIHGDEDRIVLPAASEYFFNRVFHAIYVPVEGGDHTFCTKHPWTEAQMNPALESAIANTIEFLVD